MLAAKREGWPTVVVPTDNLAEACLVDGIEVCGASTLGQLKAWLAGKGPLAGRIVDDYRLSNPYPGQQGGANVPGFDALTLGRAQLWSFGAPSRSARHGERFSRQPTHNHNDVGTPNGGLGVTVASQGFVTGPGTPGIVVLAPQFEGVENLVFNTFTMGVTITGVNQTGDTLHLRRRVEGVGRPHLEVRRPVPVPAGPTRAERDVQRHLHVCRHRDRLRLRRLSARRAEQLHPVVGRILLSA